MSTYLRCAHSFRSLVTAIPDDCWDDEGLGTWSVRTLVGHAGRSFDTVIGYLATGEPAEINTPTAEDYYTTLTAPGGPLGPGGDTAAIDARAAAAGEALGADPLASITAKVDEAARLLADQPESRRIEVIFGLTMPLTEYLRTRVLELVVHSLDLSRALNLPHDIPPDAIVEMVHLAANVAADTGKAEQLLLALTGREALPASFSVV